MKKLISLYHPTYSHQLAYMLQSTVYESLPFWRWWKRTDDFRRVQTRRTLIKTKAVRSLLGFLYLIIFIHVILAALLLMMALESKSLSAQMIVLLAASAVVFLSYPFTLPLALVLSIGVANKLLISPRRKKEIANATEVFKRHPGTIIAVAGSYGKTTAKEILKEVLSQIGETAATPGNMNVPISLARFASRLKGDEKFVVVEFGEGYKGDVAKMSRMVDPDIGIITGLAPNHLDEYETVENLAKDLFSLSSYLDHKNMYVSGDTENLSSLADHGEILFSENGLPEWKVSNVKNTIDGLSFTLTKGSKKYELSSQLVGRHLIGVLALAVALADELGGTKDQIENGISATKPFEHRLQPRQLHGAWIIDDTYNGNLEGMRVGLALLKELQTPGKKIYVTPGLVDQGEETERVHLELGKLIKDANPDRVVLMKNSVTELIKTGLQGYAGELKIIDNPLQYYQSLEMTLAAGDIALLQNDWTDNYA